MSLNKLLLAISLMVVVAFMGAASACPCIPADKAYDLGSKPVGYPICVEAPQAPAGEDWCYQWEVYIQGLGWKLPAQLPNNVQVVNEHKICVTPTIEDPDCCGKVMAVRVTITTNTDLDEGYWEGCILLLCVQWEAYNPACPTMTGFCEGHATAVNLPQGETAGYTYTYAIVELGEAAPGTPMTVERLNALAPGTYNINVYTTATGNTVICTITIKVYAKPFGDLTFS